MEHRIPVEFAEAAVVVPGALGLLQRLDEMDAPWAIVTSGTQAVVDGWVEVLGFKPPKTLVVAEDVQIGKPDPACYLLGSKRLGLDNGEDLVVIEDSPTGVQAGKAAGFRVVALTTTHSPIQVKNAGADWVIQDLNNISVGRNVSGMIEVEIKNAIY